MGSFLVIADPLEKASAVVLLSGGGLNRMSEAVRIYQERWADTIILTETGAQVPEFDAPYSKIAKFEVMDMGVPETGILFAGENLGSTLGEAKAILRLLGNSNANAIIVVTDPYHTRRVKIVFERVFADSGIRVIVRPVRGSWYKSTTWWMSLAGWQVTINEYVKLAGFYWEKGL